MARFPVECIALLVIVCGIIDVALIDDRPPPTRRRRRKKTNQSDRVSVVNVERPANRIIAWCLPSALNHDTGPGCHPRTVRDQVNHLNHKRFVADVGRTSHVSLWHTLFNPSFFLSINTRDLCTICCRLCAVPVTFETTLNSSKEFLVSLVRPLQLV